VRYADALPQARVRAAWEPPTFRSHSLAAQFHLHLGHREPSGNRAQSPFLLRSGMRGSEAFDGTDMREAVDPATTDKGALP
jgi:hypothetical protein